MSGNSRRLADYLVHIVEAIERIEHYTGDMAEPEFLENRLVQDAGVYPRVMQQGEADIGAWRCGMVAGLINNLPSVQELMDRIMAEDETLIRQRLMGLLG